MTGKKIVHEDVSAEELATRLSRDVGLPDEYAKGLAALDVMINRGGEERTNDVVLKVTGKKPRTFREFVEENKQAWI